MDMNKIILLLTFLTLLVGCSTTKTITEYKDRIEYRDKIIKDSIFTKDSVYLEKLIKGDSVFITKYKEHIVYKDVLKIDTIKVIDTKIEKEIVTKKYTPFYMYVILGTLSLIILLLIFILFKRW